MTNWREEMAQAIKRAADKTFQWDQLTDHEHDAFREEADAALAVVARMQAEARQIDRERAWREGYYTGKRDYAVSITGGQPISTPNPYSAHLEEA